MPQQIKRLISAFILFVVLFLILRQVLKPNSFGELGHYRSEAIHENTLKELHYAGSEVCCTCHADICTDKAAGPHARLKCEVCHGPGLKHSRSAEKFKDSELPDSLLLFKPVERKDCAICHRENTARRKILFDTIDNSVIRQINVMEHNLMDEDTKVEYKCIDCHNPHQP